VIADLHDITVFGIFPTDHALGVLVRASKKSPGPHLPGGSAAGIPWSDYHNFIALFDRSGQYKEAVQLPVDYMLNHFAILSSGEYLISGYDKLNSTPRLLFLDRSGNILRSLEIPSARNFAEKNAHSEPFDSEKAAGQLLGSILFTRYKDDILVWRMNSDDPILDVGPGGAVREVAITPPAMSVFVDMVPANDRWVAHFRSATEQENSAYNQTAYSYYEVNPQNGSLSSKLIQEGDIPSSLSCESDGGTYLSFKKSQDNKLIVLGAK